ncbi:MAG: secretin N-terminal domain-containing protein [Rhodocyclaceae bacterium]|nr:secretin N-terminal domain-containing protein [Rhodocyclaceae bacterium]
MKSLACLAALALLAGCAGPDVVLRGETAVATGHYEEGLALIEQAAQAPGAPQDTRAVLLRNRAFVLDRLEREGRSALDDGRLDEASAFFSRMKKLDAERAEAGLRQVRMMGDLGKTVEKAEVALRAGDLDTAQSLLKGVLVQAPQHRQALALSARLAEKAPPRPTGTPELGPEYKKHVTLEFRDVGLKAVFDAIWHASGINFVLDKDIRSDLKATIMVKDVSVEEAVEAILATQQLGKRILGPKMLFIYPRTPQKTGEYQDLMIRNFFLSHVSAKEIQNLLKAILKIKEVYADEKRNLVVVRDTPERVALADKLIQAQDQPEPEVMLAVDVIEINRSRLQDLGVAWPQKVELGIANPITLQSLRTLNTAGVNVGVGGLASAAAGTTTGTGILAQLNLAANQGDTRTLANPRIRVRNREKAKIHIGDRLPVVTTNTTVSTTNFVSQNVSYLDVGLKLEVEPEVLLDNDVVIKLNMEVSSASQDKANPNFYDVGTRNTSTVLTIRDGETQILAGLIRDDETETSIGIPGIGDVPILGRLFSSSHRNKAKSEILLAITPHVLRNLHRPAPALMEFLAGSEAGQGGASSGASSAPSAPQPSRPLPPRLVPAPNPAAAVGAFLPNLNSTFSSPAAPNPVPTSPASGASSSPVGNTSVAPVVNTSGNPVASPASAATGGSPPATAPSSSNTGSATGGATAPGVSAFEGPPGVGSAPAR